MDLRHVLYEERDGIARITLNVPSRANALDLELRFELLDLFTSIAKDAAVRVVVLQGAGKHFCSGGDIGTMEGVTAVAGRERLKKGQRLVRVLCDLEKPIIAAVHGLTGGAGLSLALSCDLVIASEDASFRLPYVKLGLVPDWGLFYLVPMRVGMARAKELMLLGEPIDASEAERIGLINRVVPRSELEAEAMALARNLAQGPTQAYAMIKSALHRCPASFESLLEIEAGMQAVALSSEDFDEGRKAFLEKRKPVFRGK